MSGLTGISLLLLLSCANVLSAQSLGSVFVRGSVHANDGGEYFPPAAVVIVSTIAGSLAGSVTGGLVGALGRRERWTRVRLEQPLRRVTLGPHAGPDFDGRTRVGLRLGVRF